MFCQKRRAAAGNTVMCACAAAEILATWRPMISNEWIHLEPPKAFCFSVSFGPVCGRAVKRSFAMGIVSIQLWERFHRRQNFASDRIRLSSFFAPHPPDATKLAWIIFKSAGNPRAVSTAPHRAAGRQLARSVRPVRAARSARHPGASQVAQPGDSCCSGGELPRSRMEILSGPGQASGAGLFQSSFFLACLNNLEEPL